MLLISIFMGVDKVYAQELVDEQENENVNVSTIATVNLYEAEIVSSEKNKFDIAFDIHNKDGYQSNIKYAVEIYKVINDVQELMDRKVYQEVITLGQDELIKKEIEYVAPSYLVGKFQVWVVARNSAGLPLAHIYAGDMELDNDKEENKIDASCLAVIDGKSGALGGGIMLEKNEKASIDCELTSKSADKIEARAKLIIGKGDGFLGEASEFENFRDVSFLEYEKKSISLEFPENREPGSYSGVIIIEKNGEILTTPLYFSYFVGGETASIANLKLDKIYYQKGETINASVFWMGTGGSIDEEKTSFKGDVNIEIVGENGDICAKKISDNLEAGVGEILLVSEIECKNPAVNVSVTKDGRELTKSSFSFKNNSSDVAVGENKEDGQIVKDKMISDKIKMLFLFGIIPFVALMVFLFKRKRSYKIFNFLLILMPIIFGMIGINSAKADTYFFNPIGGMAKGIITVNINKMTYLPGENVFMTASAYNSDTFSGGFNVEGGLSSTFLKVTFFDSFSPLVAPKTSSPIVSRFLSASFSPGNYSAFFGSRDYTCAWSSYCVGYKAIAFSVANPAVNGTCGSANRTFTATENTWGPYSFCSQGTASPASPVFPAAGSSVSWSCNGSGGGANAFCSASKASPVINGICGSANRTFATTENTWGAYSFCSQGTASPANPTFPVAGSSVSWSCNGSGGGLSSLCSASKTIPTISGSCGSSNGGTFSTSPTTNLCLSGAASAVAGSGPWSWTCNGSGGGTTASCSANKTCIPAYSVYTCSKSSSIDCGAVSNCGQSGTESASCSAIDSCTGATVSRPLSECGASCSTSSYQCPACIPGFGSGSWREVAP